MSDRLTEIQGQVLTEPRWRIAGSGSHKTWLPKGDAPALSTLGHEGIVEWSPPDRVVVVRAGTTLRDLQAELAAKDQMIPALGSGGTVGGLLAMGLPHAAEATYGPVRDWVFGMTVLLGDGTVAKVGSRVAKSVAGYDLHRVMVGSRGGLALILEANLRTFPLADLPEPWPIHSGSEQWIRRTLRSEFESEVENRNDVVARCAATATYVTGLRPERDRPGWWIGPAGQSSPMWSPDLARKIKAAVDPLDRWEEGWRA